MASGIEELVMAPEGAGFYEIVLPFLLVFALLFALIKGTGVIDSKEPAAVIALVIAIFFAHQTALSEDIYLFLEETFSEFALLIVFGFLLMVAAAVGGFEDTVQGTGFIGVLAMAGTGFILYQNGGLELIYGGGTGAPELTPAEVLTGGVILFTVGALVYMAIRS